LFLQAPHNTGGLIPYAIALLVVCGSLSLYVVSAFISRFALSTRDRTIKEFNLGLPLGGPSPENLFAISIVAAQTTLSTVFILFLTNAQLLGFHLLFCPVAFAAGISFMLFIYERVEKQGYVNDRTVSGLIPYFGFKLTNSKFIGYSLAVACLLPSLALLSLELRYGILALNYMVRRTFSANSLGDLQLSSQTFPVFLICMLLLLGYVFIGGFRAVVTSDIWQYKTMRATLLVTLISVVVLIFRNHAHLRWYSFSRLPFKTLLTFYVGVAIINLFTPLCLITTWQRFRAFRSRNTDFRVGVKSAVTKALFLWTTLIGIGVGLQLIPLPQPLASALVSSPVSLHSFLDRLVLQNDWFQFVVFPLLILAAFSGMFSASDTCVSAIIYLSEIRHMWTDEEARRDVPLNKSYYFIMAALFLLTLGMFFVVRHATATEGLMAVALNVFGNVVVVAPTVLLTAVSEPNATPSRLRSRRRYVFISLSSGFMAYWLCLLMRVGGAAVLADWAIVIALGVSGIPAYLLAREEQRERRKLRNDRISIERSRAYNSQASRL